MTVHEQVLAAVQRMCADRNRFTFTLNDIVKALPAVNANTVRTQVGSYCCINAKQHHAHRQPYFRRVGFGEYELLPKYRAAPPRPAVRRASPLKAVIHAVISQSDSMYVAECLEVAVVTQGRTLDETLVNLREAIDLHLADEDSASSGIAAKPRLAVTYETALAG
jgi:predicted RNase H-like HicB family nuclease